MSQSVKVATGAITLTVTNGIPTTTSVDVARHFGKRHDDVLRAVRNLAAQLPSEHLRNFAEASIEIDQPNGGKASYPAYRLTRDGFTLLAMGFTGKKALAFKLAYIDAFNSMEAALNSGRRDQLTNAQKQHLRELVDIIAATGKQTHAETWARLHRKFHVPSYHALPPSEFERAVGYLHGKLDTESIGALVQKHCAPLLPAPMARMDVTPEQLIKKWAEPGNYPFDVDFMHHIVQVFTERIFSAYQFQRSRANSSVNRW